MIRQSFEARSGGGIPCPVRRSKKRKHFVAQAWLCAGLFLAISRFPAWSDTYPKNPDIDILRCTFRLSLSDGTDEIVGETTVDVRFLRRGVSEFALDLVKTSSEAEGRGMTVSAVTSDLGKIRFEHDRERIDLTGQRQAYEIPVDRAPVSVVLDPDLWVLMDAEFLDHP
jgi:hypothetical protein